MKKVRDYSKLAGEILSCVGGENNIVNFSRCATRLRLVLRDMPESAVENVKKLPGVITVVLSGGQFQIVIGTHVSDVYQVFSELVDRRKMSDNNGTTRLLDSVIATMSAVFAPIIYILASAGILQGGLILLKLIWPGVSSTGTFSVLNFISWTPFAFLPVFIGLTSARHFKCNSFIALFCCCALINPEWGAIAGRIANGESISFLHFPLADTVYTSSVLPPLFLVWLLSYIERTVTKHLPDVVSPLFTPLICALIMVPFTLVLIGPVTAGLATAIASGYNGLFEAAPPLAAAVIGGFWQAVVIFGVHWGITPVIVANFDMYGRDSFQAFQTMAVIGQMAAAFACSFKTSSRDFRAVAFSAGITGIFGITEPAIYGVTLRLKKPFICGCIGAALGAITASFFGSYYYAYAGLPSVLTLVNSISPDNPSSFIGEITGAVVTIVITMSLVWLTGFNDSGTIEERKNNKKDGSLSELMKEKENSLSSLVLHSPVNGALLPLACVNDPAFSEKALGDGVALKPEGDEVISPCDAVVVSVAETRHAIGLECDNGAEILIHVGLDTVCLKGEYFSTHVTPGMRVKTGTPLIHFEKNKIISSGYDITTPVLVVNSDDFILEQLQHEHSQAGQPLLKLLPKGHNV
ncbi:glucose PTS transporter subunit IIA [Escherichia coli]|uniref:glucose PTS transporter subunit IIA n=1 Tax=Escherichia coli TaxID=562 RepID=UPI0039E0CF41